MLTMSCTQQAHNDKVTPTTRGKHCTHIAHCCRAQTVLRITDMQVTTGHSTGWASHSLGTQCQGPCQSTEPASPGMELPAVQSSLAEHHL
jgi:hypothetical protein